MPELTELQRVEALSFTILDLYLEIALDSEAPAENVAIGPQILIESVCEGFDSDLYKKIEMNEEQTKAGIDFVQGIIDKDRETLIGVAGAFIGAAINPVGKAVRDGMGAVINNCPIYIDLRNMYQGFGMDLVLGVFSELIDQGHTAKQLDSLLNKIAKEASMSTFPERLEYNIAHGIYSAENQGREAKLFSTAGSVGGAIAGAKVGAAVGSVVPGFGTVVGAGVGATLGRHFGGKAGNKAGKENADAISYVLGENPVGDLKNKVKESEAVNAIKDSIKGFGFRRSKA